MSVEDYIGAGSGAGSAHHALHLSTHHGVNPVPDESDGSWDAALSKEYLNKVSAQHLKLHGGKSFRKAGGVIPHRHVQATAANTPMDPKTGRFQFTEPEGPEYR